MSQWAIDKGQLVLPSNPGLGLAFDEKAVAAYRVGGHNPTGRLGFRAAAL
jgi:L-alanine-DL-glutamate epimerase-like enolase superfamily enzyme